jgi:hypothetical protein
MHWWTEVTDTFQFRIREPKRREPAAGRMARSLPVLQEKRRDNNAVSSVTPAHDENGIKESVPLHTGHGVQTDTGKRITMPARKTVAAPAQKTKPGLARKTKAVRFDFDALRIT